MAYTDHQVRALADFAVVLLQQNAALAELSAELAKERCFLPSLQAGRLNAIEVLMLETADVFQVAAGLRSWKKL